MKPNWLAHLILGEQYYKRGDLTQAVEHFKAATYMAPNNPWGWYWLSIIFTKQGDKASAERFFQRAANLDPALATPSKTPVSP